MKRMLKIVAAILVSICPTGYAYAANTGPGLVTNLYVQNGVVIFGVSGNVSGSWPACATTQRYAIEVASAAGQAYYSAVLSAKMAGKLDARKNRWCFDGYDDSLIGNDQGAPWWIRSPCSV